MNNKKLPKPKSFIIQSVFMRVIHISVRRTKTCENLQRYFGVDSKELLKTCLFATKLIHSWQSIETISCSIWWRWRFHDELKTRDLRTSDSVQRWFQFHAIIWHWKLADKFNKQAGIGRSSVNLDTLTLISFANFSLYFFFLQNYINIIVFIIVDRPNEIWHTCCFVRFWRKVKDGKMPNHLKSYREKLFTHKIDIVSWKCWLYPLLPQWIVFVWPSSN